jgi:hypothetical protein
VKRKTVEDYDEGLLAFVQSLYDGTLLLPVDWPVATPSVEMFQALGELVRKGSLAFVVRLGGWQKLRGCAEQVGGGRILPASELKLFEGRLWDQPSLLDGRFAVDESVLRFWMEFGEAAGRERDSAESRLSANQLEEVSSRAARSSMSGALAVHVAARRLALYDNDDPLLPLLLEADRWAPVTLAPAGFAQLPMRLAEDWLEYFSWTLPWLSADLASWWLMGERSFGRVGPKDFLRISEALLQVLRFFFEKAQERQRFDWLLPLMTFFDAAYRSEPEQQRRLQDFETTMEEASHRERQELRDRWVAILDWALEIGRERDRQFRVHPVERSAPSRLFLEHYAQSGFAARIEGIDRLRKALAGVL